MQTKKPVPVPMRRGFLLLVVVGILAVLLTLCVGFLSYTRGEVQGVASQRDKSDGLDVVHSAVDWTMAIISKDHLDSGGNFDAGTPVSYSNDNATWWYRPSEPGLTTFLQTYWPVGSFGGCPPSVSPQTETQYTYLPADFFPGGGVRGRFTVQILDTNALININDWNEDCMPTQTQMAHMMMDAYGENRGEVWRQIRDVNNGNGWWNAGMYACPIRYQEAWRAVTHTQRFLDWQLWDTWDNVDNQMSHHWVTGNTSWFTPFGPDYGCLHTNLQSDGISPEWAQPVPTTSYHGSWNYYPTDPPDGVNGAWWNGAQSLNWIGGWIGNFSSGLQPWYLSGLVCQAGVDPNTGRSPVNVNTCYNSGEVLPTMCLNHSWPGVGDQKPPTYTMEAVWNVESLRRLIKVGWFKSPADGTFKNAQTDWAILNNAEKMKIEQLKVKLAYQYQETLCRYFTGSYAHACNYRLWDQNFWPDLGTYATAYPKAPAPLPTNYCKTTDYSVPRFKGSLTQFRKNVHDDFIAMCRNNANPNFNRGVDPKLSSLPAYPDGIPLYGPDRTDGCVSFDEFDTPEVALGKFDTRVAAACYDNLYPGKPPDLKDFGKVNVQSTPYTILTTYKADKPQTDANAGCQAYTVGECDPAVWPSPGGSVPASQVYPDGDPIYELYVMQLGRQEDFEDKYQIDPNFDAFPAGSPRPPLTYAAPGAAPANVHPWLPFTDISETSATNYYKTGAPLPAFNTATCDNNACPIPPLWAMPNSVFMPHDRFLWNGWPWGWSTWWYSCSPPPSQTPKYLHNSSEWTKYNNGNNIYGYWGDNPALPALSYYFWGLVYPADGQHRADEQDHLGNGMTVCPKGRDIFSSINTVINPANPIVLDYETVDPTNVASCPNNDYRQPPYNAAPYNTTPFLKIMPHKHWVPTGPWVDGGVDPITADPKNPNKDPIWANDFQYTDPNNTTNNNVPWRQLCFTPDSFSTELTTTSNTYMVIINAELVDAASVAANPNNPALHRKLWWNQWGAVVELCPGMEPAITGTTDTMAQAQFGGISNPEINYYSNERPMLRKTASCDPTFANAPTNLPLAPNTAFYDPRNSMDTNCPTLVIRNWDNGAASGFPEPDRLQNQFGMIHSPDPKALPTSGPIDPEHTSYTMVTQWQSDIHGVPPAKSGNFILRNPVPNNGRATDVIYSQGSPTNQTQKRIILRSVWCLNDAVAR